MKLAPVILFVYNRPDHTRRTLDALAANKHAAESDLIIYADGAPPAASDKLQEQVKAVREIIAAESRFKSVHVKIAAQNLGLAASVIAGVTDTVGKHGKVIVLEDDLLTSPFFLSFMNNALTTFESNSAVACISAYIYPVDQLPDLFFLKGADCWGWATWKRSWDLFETKGDILLDQLNKSGQTPDFDFDNSYPYLQMLKDQIAGKNKSWAIRWYASAYLAGKLVLYPGRSLINNIGFDGTGMHSGSKPILHTQFLSTETIVHPIPLQEDRVAKEKIAGYFKKTNAGNFTSVVQRKLAHFFRKWQGR